MFFGQEDKKSFPTVTVMELVTHVKKVFANGKTPLLLHEGGSIRDAILAELEPLDGTGIDKDRWAIQHAALQIKNAEEKKAFEAKQVAESEAAKKQWEEDTEARKEARREIDLEGGDPYESSDEEFEFNAEKYPGPEWDGT